jgi:hypothetical protein
MFAQKRDGRLGLAQEIQIREKVRDNRVGLSTRSGVACAIFIAISFLSA